MLSLLTALSILVVITYQFPLQERATSLRLAINQNFPDPAFIEVGGTYYAFATGKNIEMATSPDFVNWKVSGSPALSKTPPWSSGNTWAPDVVQVVRAFHVIPFKGHLLERSLAVLNVLLSHDDAMIRELS